jgi:S1-C subfamily serine protease
MAAGNRHLKGMAAGAVIVATSAMSSCAASDYDPQSSTSRVAIEGRTGIGAREVERVARETTLRVRAVGCGFMSGANGTAFAVGPSLLVSNRHVVEKSRLLQVSTWDGRDFEVPISAFIFLNDLALIAVDGKLPESIVIGDRPREGDTVHAVGYPGGGAFTISAGSVVDVVAGAPYGERGTVVRSTNRIEGGNSGGPLLDSSGRLVGVVFAVDSRNGLTLAVGAEQIRLLLSETDEFTGVPETC